MPHAEALAPALLERVLSKLGLSEPPSPTLEGLRTLYPAWCRKVPFDNIRQLIHRRSHDPSPMPGGDATEFFEAWLRYGTCYKGLLSAACLQRELVTALPTTSLYRKV